MSFNPFQTPTPEPTPAPFEILNYLQTNLFNIALIVAVAIVGVVVAVFLAKLLKNQAEKRKENQNLKNKIRVVIRQEPKDEEKLVEPKYTSDGIVQFVMEPETKDRAGWIFTAPDGSIRLDAKGMPYVQVYRGATQAISFDYTDKTEHQPHWNKDDSKSFITAQTLKWRYKKPDNAESGLKIWVMVTLIVCIIAVCVAAYSAYQVHQIAGVIHP